MANVAPEDASQVTGTVPSTTSLAVAVTLTEAPAGPVASAVTGANTSCGEVVSRTVTMNEPVEVLPCESNAEQFTIVSPSANVAPEEWSQFTATLPSTTSTAVAEYATEAPVGPVASATRVPGSVSAGAVSSVTVTENDDVPMFARVSLAVHTTVVEPIAIVARTVACSRRRPTRRRDRSQSEACR
jgi:hypothetical protein